MSFNYKSFAFRLRFAREVLREMTQEELSNKSKIPSTSISKFENPKGMRKPSFDNLISLSKALNVSLDFLCGLKHDHNV